MKRHFAPGAAGAMLALAVAVVLSGCHSGKFVEDSPLSHFQPTNAEILQKQHEVYGWSCEQLATAYREADAFLVDFSDWGAERHTFQPAIDRITTKRVTLSRMDDKDCPTLNVLEDKARLKTAIETLAE